MPLLHLVVLAIVQGITEFLPISSSGHLVLVPALFGWQDQGQTMDVAVHLGTLAAVLLYFWRDVWSLVMGLFMLARGRPDQRTRLVVCGARCITFAPVSCHWFVFANATARWSQRACSPTSIEHG